MVSVPTPSELSRQSTNYLYLIGVSLNAVGVKVHAEPLSEEILVRLRFGVQVFSVGIVGCPIQSVTYFWYCMK